MDEKCIRSRVQGGFAMNEASKIRLIEISYRVLVVALLAIWVMVQ